jgi:hypothetical protein
MQGQMGTRHIVLRVQTGEQCADADQYAVAVSARWSELCGALREPGASFYKHVREISNIECEATYERDGIQFELLLELEPLGGVPDVSKPELGRAVRALFADGKVLLKRAVQPLPNNLDPGAPAVA